MNLRHIIAIFVCLGCLWHLGVDAAVHKGALETTFLPDVLYVYDYTSSAQLHSDLQLVTSAKVSVQLIEENESYQDLLVLFKDAKVMWNSTTGVYTDTTSLGDLSRWFSVQRTREGYISAVYHSSGSGDEDSTTAFKKSVTGLLSIGTEELWTRGVTADRTQLISQSSKQYEGQLKTISKLILLDEHGCISSVEATEVVQLEHTNGQVSALLGQSVHSRTTLVLIEKATPLVAPPKPDSLIADTLEITMVKKAIPLADTRKQLHDLLSSDSCELLSSVCVSKVLDLLQLCDNIETLSQELAQSFAPDHLVTLVDALALLNAPMATKAFKHLLLGVKEKEEVMVRVLHHIAVSVQPNLELASAVKALSSSEARKRVREKAQLALGSVARRLRSAHPEESAAIVDHLHQMLEHHAARRSADGTALIDAHSSSVLLGAIGNAGDPASVQLLATHAGGSAGTQDGSQPLLSAKKAALIGLGGVATLESAQAIRAIAEDEFLNLYLRKLAVEIYKNHPHGNQDLSHLVPASHTHSSRTRRSVVTLGTQDLNVSMPAVGWERHFGSSNISARLGRTTQNSFEIITDPSTSKYSFSLHDVTTFGANLLLATRSQLNDMLRAEYCFEGSASYGANVLTNFDPYLVANQYHAFSSTARTLSSAFSSAQSLITSSGAAYNGLGSPLHSTLLGVQATYQSVQMQLLSFKASLTSPSYDLKMAASNLLDAVNASVAIMMARYNASWKPISDAIDVVLPTKPAALVSSVSVGGTTLNQSTYYVPFLEYAPQQALSNIFSVYRGMDQSYSDLKDSMTYFQTITDPYGPNRVWLSPAISLNSLLTNFSLLLDQLNRVIDLAANSQSQTFNGVTTQEYIALRSSIVGYLVPALGALNSSAQQFLGVVNVLNAAFLGSSRAFQAFTNAYENARFKVDTIFGQRFIPGFPQILLSCNQAVGCGSYPSTSSGLYRAGIDLSVPSGTKVGSPVPAMVQLLPAGPSAPSAPGYNTTSTLLITPLESSYTGIYFVLTNVVPDPAITSKPTFFPAGTVPGTTSVVAIATPVTTQGSSFIHLEAYKMLDGQDYPIDPAQFLQPIVTPGVSITYACNDLSWYVGDQLVDYAPLVTSGIQQTQLGAPLVTAVPNNEFPQPVDVVITGESSVSAAQVTFFQANTFMMVGSIPVQFAFTSVGSYQLNHSLMASFLTKSLTSTITPTLQASAQGTIRVGSTQFAVVQITGDIVKSSLALTLQQSFNDWPLVANCTMDLTLAPTSLALTTQLVQQTGAGGFSGQDILTSSTLWQYAVPSIHRNEFDYEGLLVDPSPPVFTPLSHDSRHLSCYLRQILSRLYTSPAFELEFNLTDTQSLLAVAFSVGSSEGTGDYVPATALGGRRVFVPWHVAPATELHASVAAVNLNGLKAVASCSLPTFDSSPPLARINPIRLLSGHPTKMEALIALFDEYGLSDTQQVAIGTVPGAYGNDVMSWTPFNTSVIVTPPHPGLGADALNLFSFSRMGRLLESIIGTWKAQNASSCASQCLQHSSCLSFDYARGNLDCILHGKIQGPAVPDNAPYNNTFATEPLRVADGYLHYERLGAGNSSWAIYSNLHLSHNQLYYINLNLTNRLGYTNLVSSEPFLVDLTPPLARVIRNASLDVVATSGCLNYSYGPECIQPSGLPNLRTVVDGVPSATIFNGPTLFVDSLYTSINNVFTANWDGISDPESGIYSYGWCIGTSIGACNIMQFTNPFPNFVNLHNLWTSNSAATFQTALRDGTYYVSVQAINNVVYGGAMATIFEHSTPYVIDTSPPVIQFLPSGITYDPIINQLSISYLANDLQSPATNVSVAIGLTPRDTQLLDWTDVGVTGVARVIVVIPNGTPAWVKLMATNQAGLHSIIVASSSISVDRTPPTAGFVRDVARYNTTDIAFQSDNATLCAYGAGFSDPDTGIASYQWGVGTTPGGYNIVGPTTVTGSDLALGNVCYSGSALVHGTTYYSTVVATNGAVVPLSVTVTSNGVRIDITPPIGGVVKAGPVLGTSASFSSSLTTLSASWSNFSDTESGISSYVVSVQHKLPVPSLLATLTVKGSTVTWTQLSLHNGDTIVVTVQATNGAGLITMATSNNIVIDITPPQLVYLVDGLSFPQDLDSFNSTDNLTSSWSVSDPQSGISRVETAVYQLQGGQRTRVLPNPLAPNASLTFVLSGGSSSWTARGLQLVSGTRYITSVIFTNGAGLKVEYTTNGVLVDLTPPTMQYVTVYPSGYSDGNSMVTVADPTEVEGRWLGTDAESSVLQYVVGIVDVGGVLVQAMTSFGRGMGGVLSGLSLTSGGLYRMVVTAVDAAGHVSSPAYSDIFIVAPGDFAGIVSDGDDPNGLDIDYTDEITAISATFSGFLSQSCGGIARFEWAVGQDPALSKESVLPFTDSGVVVVGNGSGYAQVLLSGLGQYGKQPLFVTVRGVTGCDRILESTSNGFIIDPTPPLLQDAHAGLYALEYATYSNDKSETGGTQYETTPTYSATWKAADLESDTTGLAWIKKGTYPGGNDIGNYSATAESFVRAVVSTRDGLSSYVTITVKNNAGLESTAVTNAVVMDTSPPVFGELVCPAFIPALYSSSARTFSGSLSCLWRNVIDPESGISQYSITIGTSSNDASLLNSTLLPGYSNEFISPVLQFSTGVGYYVTLLAINNAGLSESYVAGPIYYQTTPPVVVGSVTVQPNVAFSNGSGAFSGLGSAACLLDTDVVQLYFSDFSDSLSIVRYEVGIGSDAGRDDLLTYSQFYPAVTNGGLTTVLSHVWLNPQSRQAVYFNVRGHDQAGLYSTMSSGPVFIVSASNTLQDWIHDGPNLNSDVDYQNVTNYTSSYFYFGINCPIQEFRWAVESADGLLVQDYVTSVVPQQPSTSVNNTFFVSTDRVELYNGETYRVLVQARDSVGRIHVLRSNGFAVTTKGLKTGIVRDGLVKGFEANFQMSLDTLSAHWFDFGDGSPEQAIAYYEVAVGNSREFPSVRSNVVPFREVGTAQSYTMTGLSLVPMATYYVTVRAHGVSGSWADATSNGITVGVSSAIVPGKVALPFYQSDLTSVTAYWNNFEGSLPVQSYQWALGTRLLSAPELSLLCGDITSNYSSHFDVLGFIDVGTDTIGTATGLSLRHNTTYFAAVRALDQAGQCVVTLSNPLLVDTTPPLTRPIVVGPNESSWNVPSGQQDHVIYVQPGTDLRVTWTGFPDQESGVAMYEVALAAKATCSSLLTLGAADYIYVGLGLEYTFERPSLMQGVVYSVMVRATNRANLTSVALSEPVLQDTGTLLRGSVIDGTNWQTDAVFQSSLGTLSATFAHALLGGCPDPTTYIPSDGGKVAPPTLVGLSAQSTMYVLGQVTASPSLGLVNISSTLDSTGQYLVSGAYQIPVSFTDRETVSVEIQTASGDPSLQPNVVTSLVFVDSPTVTLAEFEQGVASVSVPVPFGAVGLQIHPSRTLGRQFYPQQIVLWAYTSDPLSAPLYVTKNTTLDLSVPHEYSLSFYSRQLDTGVTRSVELSIDEQLVAVLYGIPGLSNLTRMAMHVFTQDSPLPVSDSSIATPVVVAVFSNIVMTRRPAGVCGYGVPFYSAGSPVVTFRVAAGTAPGDTSVRNWQNVLLPCTPCGQATQPCYNYGCNQTCTAVDPYTFTFTLYNLTLASGSYSAQLQQQGSSSPPFLPATYYITVEAISASGQRVQSSSNGITIDTTPPLLTSPILHYDAAYSTSEAVQFQGSNGTIMATWEFSDPESGVISYEWAVGSSPYGQDLQPFRPVGIATRGVNSSLVGLLKNNGTYYATVRAYNGAGLSWTATSSGVTYVATSLNSSALALLVQVMASSQIVFQGAGRLNQTVLLIQTESSVGVIWKNVFKDVKSIYWYIGSTVEGVDVLPRTEVDFGSAQSATIANGLLYLNGTAFVNLSEIIALNEGKTLNPNDSYFSFEPGRSLYHTVEFCNYVHRCVKVDSNPVFLLRPKDIQVNSPRGRDVTLVLTNIADTDFALPLDSDYTVTVKTTGGLLSGTRLFMGSFNSTDIARTYRSSVPYISNPAVTMGQTSRVIARRFTDIAGPSFYVSFLGQASLYGPLLINTTFSTQLDPTRAVPELAYWDSANQLWREVGATCGGTTAVDWNTYTIAAQVCSTIINSTATNITNPPAYFNQVTQFMVIQLSNFTINTPPVLILPAATLLVSQDSAVTAQLQYTDREGDTVNYYLASLPTWGNATVTLDGLLTYVPCKYCYGTDSINIYVRERPYGSNIPLSNLKTLYLQVSNQWNSPQIFLYSNTSSSTQTVSTNATFRATIDSNRTVATTVARVGAYDFDGYVDELAVVVQSGLHGTAAYSVWVTMVNTPQSAPARWAPGTDVSSYLGYVAFVGFNVTYLPYDSQFVGTDTIRVRVRDRSGLQSDFLSIQVEVLPSWCQNNGVCGGSKADPSCTNLTARRSGFSGYNCSCPAGYGGQYCQVAPTKQVAQRACPVGIPVVTCSGNPCANAVCPSNPLATCVPNYCGNCFPQWYLNGTLVQCSVNTSFSCKKPLSGFTAQCSAQTCPCPVLPYTCPQDSILVEFRTSNCCVTFQCSCPNSSCPYLVDGNQGVYPLALTRGNRFPGTCCPNYTYVDIDECQAPLENLCSRVCTNQPLSYSCKCPSGQSLAADGFSCGVCGLNGLQYLMNDRVEIGCNWCICQNGFTQERWNCTAHTCQHSCIYNGQSYPIGSRVQSGVLLCNCLATDTNAAWSCSLLF